MSKRERDYLFIKPGSMFWRVRFQAGGKSTERSLGTTDRAEAEQLAWPLIGQHGAAVAARRPRARQVEEMAMQPRPEPYPVDNGVQIVATPNDLVFWKDGAVVDIKPNRQFYAVIEPPTKLTWEPSTRSLACSPRP